VKKIILPALFGLIFIALILTVFYYQNQGPAARLQLNHPGKMQTAPETKADALWPVNHDTVSYTLQNHAIHITFNKGHNWIKVPVETDALFGGEYNGNREELIEGSYILTQNRAGFLTFDEADGENTKVVFTWTPDQGKTWRKSVVTGYFPSLRFRKVAFINAQSGYVILSGDRTMSQEVSRVYLTHNGGQSWKNVSDPGGTRLISDGGFVNASTGFLSYGTINPEKPDLYVTRDGGKSWEKASIHIPEKYQKIFVTAEVPKIEGDHLSVLVSQGPNGDYQGGKLKGKFISKDNGRTWTFSMEVQQDETEHE
jgi:hypothetical protein